MKNVDFPDIKPEDLVGQAASYVTRPIEYYRSWRYRNTGLLIASLLLLYLFADAPVVRSSIAFVGSLGYVGAFLTGVFFVSAFTVAPALVVLYHLADLLNPWYVALLAGAGSVVGDYIIFRFLKDELYKELEPLFSSVSTLLGKRLIGRLFQTPYFIWALPILGAFIIASPIPDEVGIGLLGLSKIKAWQFLLLTFVLNALGIFAVIVLARSR